MGAVAPGLALLNCIVAASLLTAASGAWRLVVGGKWSGSTPIKPSLPPMKAKAIC